MHSRWLKIDTDNVHYIYNLQLIKIVLCTFPGVLQADPGVIREHNQIFRLFCHECQRVFHDRLINKTDKKYFYGILSEMASKHFSKVILYFNSYCNSNNYVYMNVHTVGCECREIWRKSHHFWWLSQGGCFSVWPHLWGISGHEESGKHSLWGLSVNVICTPT